MTWREFMLARLLLAEEGVGSHVRAAQRKELSEEEQTQAILRERGMVG